MSTNQFSVGKKVKNMNDFKNKTMSLIEMAASSSYEDEKPKQAKKAKGKGMPKDRPVAIKYIKVAEDDPDYDDDLHGHRGTASPKNTCRTCRFLGHRGRDHYLPPHWPEKLHARLQRGIFGTYAVLP